MFYSSFLDYLCSTCSQGINNSVFHSSATPNYPVSLSLLWFFITYMYYRYLLTQHGYLKSIKT